MDNAFKYIINNKGIDTEASYKYTATGPNQCRYNAANRGATLSNYHDIPQGSESSLLNSVYITPVSVAIDASHSSFQFYSSGVYYEPSCSPTQLDHGVLAVGFGTMNGKDYWLVKNSWGGNWGASGYILMSRNRNNNCGIATAASYPYTATGPNPCKYNPANNAATLSSLHDIPRGDENSLFEAVYMTPTSVAIDASHQSFQFYSTGVYYEAACSTTALDHGVLAVGFGVESGKDYWLVKNSWGGSWGQAGYIRMSRNRSNNCGIATSASYPIV